MNRFIKLYWIVFFAIVLTACQKWNIEPNEVQDVKTDAKVTKEPIEDTIEKLNIVDLDINEIVSEEVIDESENSDGEKIPQIKKIELKSTDYVKQLPDIIRDKRDGKYYIVLKARDKSKIKAGGREDEDFLTIIYAIEAPIGTIVKNDPTIPLKYELLGFVNKAKGKASRKIPKLTGGNTIPAFENKTYIVTKTDDFKMTTKYDDGFTLEVELGKEGDGLNFFTSSNITTSTKTKSNDAVAKIYLKGTIKFNPSIDFKYEFFESYADIIIDKTPEDIEKHYSVHSSILGNDAGKKYINGMSEKLQRKPRLKELLIIYYQDLVFDLKVGLDFTGKFDSKWELNLHPELEVPIATNLVIFSINSKLKFEYDVGGKFNADYHYTNSDYMIRGMRIARDEYTTPLDIKFISEDYNEVEEELKIVAKVKIGAGIYIATTIGVKLFGKIGPELTLKGGLKAEAIVQELSKDLIKEYNASEIKNPFDHDFKTEVIFTFTVSYNLNPWGLELKILKGSSKPITLISPIIKLPTELKPENLIIKLPTESGDSFDEINNTSLELKTEYTIPLKLKGLFFKEKIDSFIPTLVYFTDGDENNKQLFWSDTSGNVEVKYTPKTIGNKTLTFIINDGEGKESIRKEVEVTVKAPEVVPPPQNLKPTLSLPNNGATAILSANGVVQLSWTAPNFTEIHSISYNILYSDNASPSDADFTTLATNITGLTYDATVLTAGNTYFWKVVSNFKEENQNLKYTGTSEKFSFTVSPPLSDTIFFKFTKVNNSFLTSDVTATIDTTRKIIWYHLGDGLTAEKLSNLTPTVSNELTKKVKEGDGELTDFLAPQTYTLTTGGVTEDYQVQVQAIKDRSDLRLILVEALKTTNKGPTANLNFIDTSKITNMSGLFKDNRTFNGNVSLWDVSKVTNMSNMFDFATQFNSDISSWNVSAVKYMSKMFSHAFGFNSDLSLWDVSNVEDMLEMFYNSGISTSDLSKWNVSNVKNMAGMFMGAFEFNSDLSSWNVSKVEDMSNMFYAQGFRVDIRVSQYCGATCCGACTRTKSEFTSDLSSWNVGKVTDMRWMFYYAKEFTSNLSSWNVSKVTNHTDMFEGATLMTEGLQPTFN